MFGPIEEDPEYKLIVQANNLTVEIDNEVGQYLTIFHLDVPSCLGLGLRYCDDAVCFVCSVRSLSCPVTSVLSIMMQLSFTSTLVISTQSDFQSWISWFPIHWTTCGQYR